MPRRLPIALTALALGLAACGSDDEPTTTEPANEQPAAPADSGEGLTVSMKDNSFAPAQATVKVGEKVTWTNAGQVGHNATSTEGEKVESGTMDPGATFEFTPTEAGTIAYVCTFHSGMTGSLSVE